MLIYYVSSWHPHLYLYFVQFNIPLMVPKVTMQIFYFPVQLAWSSVLWMYAMHTVDLQYYVVFDLRNQDVHVSSF